MRCIIILCCLVLVACGARAPVDVATLMHSDGDLPSGITVRQLTDPVPSTVPVYPEAERLEARAIERGGLSAGYVLLWQFPSSEKTLEAFQAARQGMDYEWMASPLFGVGDSVASTSTEGDNAEEVIRVLFRRCNKLVQIQYQERAPSNEVMKVVAQYATKLDMRLLSQSCS